MLKWENNVFKLLIKRKGKTVIREVNSLVLSTLPIINSSDHFLHSLEFEGYM